MNPIHLNLEIDIDYLAARPVTVRVLGDTTIKSLIQQLVNDLNLSSDEGWSLSYQDEVLDPDQTLASCLPAIDQEIKLLLSQEISQSDSDNKTSSLSEPNWDDLDDDTEESISVDSFSMDCQEDQTVLSCSDDFFSGSDVEDPLDAEMLLTEDDAEMVGLGDEVANASLAASFASELPAPPAPLEKDFSPEPTKQFAQRRATVRYYNRMNPERAYPLLVIISKKAIQKVQKRNVAQDKSGPFQVALDSPVEIEPIIPGCDCYPPKITTRLSSKDLEVTFRIVPRVIGKIDGSSVKISQDNLSLAEIPIDVAIKKRVGAMLCAASTILLPAASSLLHHFEVDFAQQNAEGFSFYVSALHLLFNWITPVGLTMGLGVVTGLLWWTSSPRKRDVFWDINKSPADLLLAQISSQTDSQQRLQAFLNILRDYPDHHPTLLQYSDFQVQLQDFEQALIGYERAFELGSAQSQHYARASLCASKMNDTETALSILQQAEEDLPVEQFSGAMFFNLACYLTRLGKYDTAMSYLPRAIAAVYQKVESYKNDPDLLPLRELPEFQELVENLVATVDS